MGKIDQAIIDKYTQFLKKALKLQYPQSNNSEYKNKIINRNKVKKTHVTQGLDNKIQENRNTIERHTPFGNVINLEIDNFNKNSNEVNII